ncbi:hypothetical protein OCU04_005001 [Sclerotinia nivalis]|uniref:Uncharacterized protein n=1 Tax=Sclerotinia nivalis TaxID=352851 RepID=A0A9X0AN98_9HELO|nr:hypothetical protein OCU04_005001 [Sclerotinia nivalis]
MQPNQRYPSPAQYGTNQISVATLIHPQHAQPSDHEGRIYQEEQIELGFRVKCRHPKCVTMVDVNAPFGACNIHRDELSDWDFSYCDAEMRASDRGDSGFFFPNGQCIYQIRQSWHRLCQNHTLGSYSHRKLFQDSEEAKEGKWFVGRHKGTAHFPVGYGTSKTLPWAQRKNVNTAPDHNSRVADSY